MEWQVDPQNVCFHLGRRPERDYSPPPSLGDASGDAWRHPLEDPNDGCPGGDQRCRFVNSLGRYMRSQAEGGTRVSNPLLDRCDDWLVVDAVLEYEGYQDAAASARCRHDVDVREAEARK